jgi:hypothetical protein
MRHEGCRVDATPIGTVRSETAFEPDPAEASQAIPVSPPGADAPSVTAHRFVEIDLCF